MEATTLWQRTLSKIKKQVNETQYNHWFSTTKIRKIDDIIKTVYLENNKGSFHIKLIKERYLTIIENSIEEVSGIKYKVIIKSPEEYDNEDKIDNKLSSNFISNFINEGEENKTNQETTEKNKYISKSLTKQRLFNPRFTFDNFVVGPSNELAYSAALAVAKSPSESYNPLFLYGESGLGKTHLMHAIGIYLLEHKKNINILYVDTEMFTNELIKALKEGKIREFKNKYRNVDVLLVDDIQFLEGKAQTQEEFFHTFNTLYGLNKQIIISSDRPPNELVKLEERLRSRFAWNLIANISPADYETRVAILLKKAENMNIVVDENCQNVIHMIANKITHNIRELEGSFLRVSSFSTMMHENITVPFAKRILNDTIDTGENAITLEKIKSCVAKYYKVKVSDIESKTRQSKISYPRQVAMYLCRNMTEYSFDKIGNIFGGRHYSTVMHACDKIEFDISIDEDIKNDIEKIKKLIED